MYYKSLIENANKFFDKNFLFKNGNNLYFINDLTPLFSINLNENNGGKRCNEKWIAVDEWLKNDMENDINWFENKEWTSFIKQHFLLNFTSSINFELNSKFLKLKSFSATNDVRYYLEGLTLDFNSNKLFATNGKEMVVVNNMITSNDIYSGHFIINKLFVNLLNKVNLTTKSKKIVVETDLNSASFSFDDVTVYIKNVNASLINYLHIFEKNKKTFFDLKVDKKTFKKVLSECVPNNSINSKQTKQLTITLNSFLKNNKHIVSFSDNNDNVLFKKEMPLNKNHHPLLFNKRFYVHQLNRLINLMEDDCITIYFNSQYESIIFVVQDNMFMGCTTSLV